MLPPAVAGIALLAALGPSGILGGALEDAGIQLTLRDRRRGRGAHVRGLAVLPAPGPGGIRGARPQLARRLAHARRVADARRSRASRSRPRAPGLVTGGALAFGRALGEFGATLMFAGSLAGHHPDRAARDLRALRDRLRRPRSRCRRCSSPSRPRSCSRSSSSRAMLSGTTETRLAVLAVTAEHRLGDLELDVALEVAAGECLALAGPSGAGKTQRAARRSPGLAGARARAASRAATASGSTSSAASTCRRRRAAAATCSRTTRCSRT